MKANRIALAATAAVSVAATAACSDSGDAAPDGEIDVWIAFTDYRLDWMEDLAEDFSEEHPDYNVNITGYDNYEPLFDAVNTASEQGDPPALVQYFEAATQKARDAVNADGEPMFTSIESAIDGRDEVLGEPVVLDDVVDSVKNYYTIDGEFSSMPWNTSTTLMFSNDSQLSAAGVDEVPETWEGIEAACDDIMSADDAPEHCITLPNHSWFAEQAVAQQGGLFVNNDNGRSDRADEVNLDSSEMVNYVEWLQELQDKDYLYYSGKQNDWTGPLNAFSAQKSAFFLTSSGEATDIVNTGADAGFDVNVSRTPYNSETEFAGNLIGGATMWMTNGLSEINEDGALAFMQYLNNPENAADWHKTTGYIPITYSAEERLEEEGWFEENPYQTVANEQLALADDSPASSGALVGSFVSIREEVTAAVEAVLVSGDSPEERLSEAQEKAQQLLDDYNKLYVD
ncbi:extracellular solute-binding protein [Haloglycomyces albus]|uniref:extracellular solute-binding protein n=1 Tax=Haloglycomyces albus TaxID=526067 RepID=UPI00046CDC72|nr:extracellular solute-binding protein [Haloglycomyces albus]